MRFSTIVFVAGLVLCSTKLGAQQLREFLNAVPGTPKGEVIVVNNNKLQPAGGGDPLEVVSAISGDGKPVGVESMKAAYQQLSSSGNGVRAIACEQGLGWVATATEVYNTKSKNEDLVLLSQRAAALRADLQARKLLVQTLNGLSLASKKYLVDEMHALNIEEGSLANSRLSEEEVIETTVRGVLRGAVTWRIDDRPDKGEVQVSIVTTPRIQKAIQLRSAGVVRPEKLKDGIDYVLAKIRKHVITPVGGNFITVKDGRGAFIGYGSALKRSNVNVRLQQRLSAMAHKQAEARSLRGLLAAIMGESLRSKDRFSSEFRESVKQYDEIVSERGNTKIERKKIEELRTSVRSHMKSEVESLAKGSVPPGVVLRSYEDVHWVWTVALYFPKVSQEARKLSGQVKRSGLVSGGAHRMKSYLVDPDGTMRRTAEGRLIPRSLGSGQVADPADLGVKHRKG